MYETASHGDGIDVTLGEWKNEVTETEEYLDEFFEGESRNREGELDYSVSLHVARIKPDADFPNVATSPLPQRVVRSFPDIVLRDPITRDPFNENPDHVYLNLSGRSRGDENMVGYLEVEVERLIKRDFSPDGVDEEIHVFDEGGELVPKTSGGDGPSRRNGTSSGSPEKSFCPGCGENVENSDAAFCPYCGTEL